MFRLNGWKKDPHNAADLPFSALPLSTDHAPHIIKEFTPISNQGKLGSCVGNATTDALEILLGVKDPASVVQLSRLMTYWIARLLTGEQDVDGGTFIRNAFAQLANLGVCPESLWPYDEGKVLVSPSIQAFESGDANKITSYYRITTEGQARLNDIQKAIYADHPVVFGTTVGSNFMPSKGDEVVDVPKDAVGGHAIMCTGVRVNASGKREFYIRNSWGSGWRLEGHVWLTEEYMMWNQTQDLWVPTLMPTLIV